MKIAMITGSYPPDICGVGDYTHCLVQSLKKNGVLIEVVCQKDFFSMERSISIIKPDIIHMQYPTVGYGAKFSPHLFSLLHPLVMTIHEVSQSHFLRRLSLYSFSFRTEEIIFTNNYELKYSTNWAPWIKKRSSVIPIGSSIPIGTSDNNKDFETIVYFGLIRPDKGIEEVIALAKLIVEKQLQLKIKIIGAVSEKEKDYFKKLKYLSINLPILWETNVTDSEVASMLARSAFAYCPFPDGASERRSSLLALLANSVAVVTTKGPFTSDELTKVVKFSNNSEQALQAIMMLIEDRKLLNGLAKLGKHYSDNFSWDSIAKKHVKLYQTILNEREKR